MAIKKSGIDNTKRKSIPETSPTEEYGRGSGISAAPFFIFGLLTFWIYTIFKFHFILKLHMSERLRYFEKLLGTGEWSSGRPILDEFRKKGSRRTHLQNYVCMILNLLAVSLFVFEVYSKYMPLPEFPYKELILKNPYAGIGLAGLLFYISSVIYIARSARNMKDHEHYELQLVFFYNNQVISEPDNPPEASVKRWNRFRKKFIFYLLFSLPAALIPYAAVLNINGVIESGGDPVHNIYGWAALLGFLTAFFTYWCILLFRVIYDGHVKFELAKKWNLLVRSVEGGRDIVAIMLTDMVGFSKTMEIDEEAAYLKLREHNDAIRKFIELYGGVEVKTMGDAFLVKFNNPVDAVNAAIKIQIVFDLYNEDKEEEEFIFLRIGIHYGKVIVEENDIMGNGVNVAARIEPLAVPGCISITQEVHDLVEGKIDAGILKIGKTKLKNIEKPQELFLVITGKDGKAKANRLNIINAFQKNNWNFSKAAWELGVKRSDLMSKIKQNGIIHHKTIQVNA